MITKAVAKLVSKVGSADVADLNLKKVFSHTSFNGRIFGNKKNRYQQRRKYLQSGYKAKRAHLRTACTRTPEGCQAFQVKSRSRKTQIKSMVFRSFDIFKIIKMDAILRKE